MRLFKLALTIALAMFIIDGATAQAQTTYYSNGDVSWRDNNAWQTGSCSGTPAGAAYPVAGDTAYICAGDTVSLGANDEAVLVLNIAGTLNTGSNTLTISGAGCDLNVTGTGVLNIQDQGMVLISSSATGHSIETNARINLVADESVFRIAANTTIGGSGAIVGSDGSAGIEVRDSVTFTSTTTIAGHLEIRDYDYPNESGSFTNQGTVHANSNGGTLLVNVRGTLDDNSSGQWRASNGGLLEFGNHLDDQDVRLQLQGDFFISGSGSEIQFDEQPNYSGAASYPFFLTTGHLEMSDGTLDVDEDVSMGSIDEYALITGGQIVVAQGMKFEHQ